MTKHHSVFYSIFGVALLFGGCLFSPVALAQDKMDSSETHSKHEYTLTILGVDDPALKPVTDGLQRDFQGCYSRLIKRFGNLKHPTPDNIVITFEKGMDHPAHAVGDTLTFSTEWFQKHPEDLGVLTHELTHIVQHYPDGGTGWLVEGIADYSRFKYGAGEGWKLPESVRPKDNYTNAYRVTARFLLWIEKRHDKKFVDKVHKKLQAGTFKVEDIQKITGKTVEELWEEYAADVKFKPEPPKAIEPAKLRRKLSDTKSP